MFIYPAGYEIRDADYRLIRKPTIPLDVVRAALRELGRFYRERPSPRGAQ